jgi:thiol-disulfide isomerase/thioredoxin
MKILSIRGFALLALIAFVFAWFRFGCHTENLRLGNQSDLITPQKYDFENSEFYKTYFRSDSLLVLNYWATWCVPCIQEIPILNSVKEEFANEEIAFISLSVDTDSLKLVDFLSKESFNFTDITLENREYRTAIMNVLRGKETDSWIGAYSVPATYFVKNKRVLKVISGMVDKDEMIRLIDEHK